MTIKNHLNARLVDFGLSLSEAKVYVTLLEHGKELGGTKLALITDLHRQYIYLALPKLLQLGLVEEVGESKHKKYRARPPVEVEKIGRKRALEAGELAQELNQISNIGNEQEFEVIQGKRAFQAYEISQAMHATKGDVEYIIGGASAGFKEVMDDMLFEYLDLKKQNGVQVQYVGSEDERELYGTMTGMYENQGYRFIKKLPSGVAHMVIRRETVSFYTFLNPPLVYVVKSPVIAQNYKDFFMMLWEMGEE